MPVQPRIAGSRILDASDASGNAACMITGMRWKTRASVLNLSGACENSVTGASRPAASALGDDQAQDPVERRRGGEVHRDTGLAEGLRQRKSTSEVSRRRRRSAGNSVRPRHYWPANGCQALYSISLPSLSLRFPVTKSPVFPVSPSSGSVWRAARPDVNSWNLGRVARIDHEALEVERGALVAGRDGHAQAGPGAPPCSSSRSLANSVRTWASRSRAKVGVKCRRSSGSSRRPGPV